MSSASATAARTSATSDLALIAVFAALIAGAALVPGIPVGVLGVPITLQTLAIGITGIVLGARRGFLATLLYVVLGIAGLPIFSGGRGGPGVMAGASAGYIVAFPLFAALAGFLAYRALRAGRGRWWLLALAGLVASFITVHPLGIAGMAINGKLPVDKAFLADLPFWPGDVIKNLVAGFVAAQVHRAFPTLAGRR